MRKALLTIIFLFLLAVSGFSTSITVSAFTISDWHYSGTTFQARAYALQTFTTNTGSTVLQGSGTTIYRTASCTVSGSNLNCNSLTLESTSNSLTPSAQWAVDIYDNFGRFITRYYYGFHVPDGLGTTITFDQIRIYNQSKQVTLPSTYYTADQTNILLSGISGGGGGPPSWGSITGSLSSQSDLNSALAGKQSSLTCGTSLKTINSNCLLGSGDLAISGGGAITLANTYSNSLPTAIATIGSTPTTLTIDQATTLSVGATVPSNILLQFTSFGKITVANNASLVFQGPGLTNPLDAEADIAVTMPGSVETRDFYFSGDTMTRAGHGLIDGQRVRLQQNIGTPAAGLTANGSYYVHVLDSSRIQFATTYANAIAGTVIHLTSGGTSGQQGVLYVEPVGWSGSTFPSQISTEIFDTGTNSITDRLRILRGAFWSTTGVTFRSRVPRPITSYVQFRDNQSVYFESGDFTNTYTITDSVGAPFVMASNSRFSSDGSARIYSTDNVINNCNIVTTGGTSTAHVSHVIIENNYFKDGGAVDQGGNQTAASIFECDYCTVRNNKFDGIHSYDAGIIGNRQNLTDLIPQYDTLENNVSLNHVSQLYYIISCKHCKIFGNSIYANTAPAYPQAAIFDLEPNTQYDIIQDVEIAENRIIADGYPSFWRGIELQSIYTDGITQVFVHHNTILGNSTYLLDGIEIDHGASDIEIADNRLDGVGFASIAAGPGRRINIHDNFCGDRTGVSRMFLTSIADSKIYNNTVDELTEGDEQTQFISSDGTGKVDLVYPDGSPEGGAWQWFVGEKVFFNETEYTISTVSSNATDLFVRHITTSPTFPLNIAAQGVASTSVDTTNNEITTPANHLLVTGDIVVPLPRTGASAPGGLPAQHHYYVIKTANNKYKLADTHAHALATTAIDLKDFGSLTLGTNPVNTETIAINGVTFTFVTGSSTATNVHIGATKEDTAANLQAVLAASSNGSINIATYTVSSNAVTITESSGGGSYTLANSSSGNVTRSGATLTPGTGTVDWTPGWTLRFDTSDYSNNTIGTTFLLNSSGYSQILSTATDRKVTNVADADHTSTFATGIVCFGTRTTGRTENLPSPVGLQGKEIIVKDCSGQASTYNITVATAAGLIDGSSTYVMDIDRSAARFKSDGTNWYTVF